MAYCDQFSPAHGFCKSRLAPDGTQLPYLRPR